MPHHYLRKIRVANFKKVIRNVRASMMSLTLTPDALDNHPRKFEGHNSDYTKFIVLAHERSGSSLVIRTLRKHPQIISFGEVLNKARPGFRIEGYDDFSLKLFALRNKYPIDFLERYIFPGYQEDIKAVGFKLFPHHIDHDRFRCVWHWLDQNRDVKIIFLTRQNLLATYTSLSIAREDKRFSIKDDSERSKTTITIDPIKCLAYFQRRKQYNEDAREHIKNHEVMDVTYEELSKDPHFHLQEAHNFLGFDVSNFELGSVKQEVRPLSEIIDNYDELHRHLSDTEWQYLFDEQ